jgi:hypothetical protein
LVEPVDRKGNVPPPHIHHREDVLYYTLAGEIVFSVAMAQSRERLELRASVFMNHSGFRWTYMPPFSRTRNPGNLDVALYLMWEFTEVTKRRSHP